MQQLLSVLFFCLLGYGKQHEIAELDFLSVLLQPLLLAVSVSCSFSLCTGLMLPCWFHKHRQFLCYDTLSPLGPGLEVSPYFSFFILIILLSIMKFTHWFSDDVYNGDRYIIVSGSTDGSITLWDLTDTIHGFMQLVSETQPHMVIDCQKRPKTGRGSQGGRRRWRSLANNSVKKGNEEALHPSENNLNTSCASTESSHETSGAEENEVIHTENTTSSVQSCEIPEVQPMQVFSGVHQSGVNCLHVSEMRRSCSTTGMSSYCIISGGDDQAVQCFVFTLGSLQQGCSRNTANLSSPTSDALKILCQHTVPSAHGSAVKGLSGTVYIASQFSISVSLFLSCSFRVTQLFTRFSC